MATTATRAQELVAAFEMANESVIAAVERCSEAELRTVCDSEGWPLVVTAHHLALAYGPIAGMILALANGQPLPQMTMEQLDELNAQHAREAANVSREETVALLRREGRAAADKVRGLTAEQLDRSGSVPLLGGAVWSAEQMIEGALIGHPADHGQSIQAALEAQAAGA
jgi:hypothetical protein